MSHSIAHLTILTLSNFMQLSIIYSFTLAPILDFNAQDNAGNTPLHVAVECDAYEALDYLLSM